MADWPGLQDSAPYAWTAGGGILGRLMFHAKQVQSGKRKAFGWVLLLDLPIALAMGWVMYGLCAWLELAPEPTISLSIVASYLGPWWVDRLFALAADKYFGVKRGAGL